MQGINIGIKPSETPLSDLKSQFYFLRLENYKKLVKGSAFAISNFLIFIQNSAIAELNTHIK